MDEVTHTAAGLPLQPVYGPADRGGVQSMCTVVTAGEYRLVGSPVRVAGYEPRYGPSPRLGEPGGPAVGAEPVRASRAAARDTVES